ncbi:MAG: fructan beta-fructosidase [Saprospiraceae bacterium]|jgi:fructan beta-fructosidase
MNKIFKALFFVSIIFLSSCQDAKVEESSKKVDTMSNADSTYYTEQYRNQFHFSPEANWMNDPNGMVYYDGEYHLFYQYYPDSTVWGPMHWAHAVSRDMVIWEHLPIALFPDSLGYIFSGSAVIDHKNTSGFGKDGKAPMIAIFTHHNMAGEKAGGNQYQYQSIAYSNDRGRTWAKYEGNPVVPNPGIKDFRDPKVIWHEATQRWVMVFAAYDRVRIYNSPNLKDWIFASEFGIPGDKRLWECPDLFPMKIEGTDNTKWVLITSIQQQGPNGGTATAYFVGDFDGRTFNGDYKKLHWVDYGTDNYAMVTWSDVSKEDGRTLALGWMNNWQYAQVVPTEKWRSAMTLPRVLTLHKTSDDFQIRSLPVKELTAIEGEKTRLETKTYSHLTTVLEKVPQQLYKLDLSFKKPFDSRVGVRFSNSKGEYTEVFFDGLENSYFIDRTKAGESDFSEHFAGLHRGAINYDSETVDMLIYLDFGSIELFADAGRCVMTEIIFPSPPYSKIEIIGEKNNTELLSGTITELKDIWRK